MEKFFFFLLLIFVLVFANANSSIVLESNGQSSVHSTLDDAYNAAKDGDIIIIPGGYWKGFTMNVEKSLTIIGAGYDPRYTVATGVTNYIGELKIAGDNISIEGLSIDSDIKTYKPSEEISEIKNLVISRCKFGWLTSSASNYSISNVTVKESVFQAIRSSVMYDPQYFETTVSNCFILNGVRYLSGISVENCIVVGTSFEQIGDINFKNNLFTSWGGSIKTWSRRINYINNVFVKDEITFSGAEINTNNQTNVDINTIFQSEVENADDLTFDYMFDFIYKSDSPTKNAGDDGSDIGVWGGKYPWKKVAVPMLPYIKEAKVAPATNASGKLNIEFKIEAQTK